MAGSKRRRRPPVDTLGPQNYASPPAKNARVSARLQSLYSPSEQQTVVNVVRAGMPYKVRPWVKHFKAIGGEGPQSFSVPRWAPTGPLSPDLQAIKHNAAPRARKAPSKGSPRASPAPGSASESANEESRDGDAAHRAAREAMVL
jgi:hypothetical protein